MHTPDLPYFTAACFAPPALVVEYRTLWTEIWATAGAHRDYVNAELRAIVLAFLADGVPAKTARTIVNEHMRGLTT